MVLDEEGRKKSRMLDSKDDSTSLVYGDLGGEEGLFRSFLTKWVQMD